MDAPLQETNSAGRGVPGDQAPPERRAQASAETERRRHLSRRASDVVRNVRESMGLDRRSLAERVGVPEQIIALWEDPTYEGVDLAILRRVAKAAGGELEIRFHPRAESSRAAG